MRFGRLQLLGMAGAAGAAAIALWGLVLWQAPFRLALNRPPPSVALPMPSMADESSVSVQLTIPAKILEDRFDDALPVQLPFAGSGKRQCVKLPLRQKLCSSLQYQGVVRREGDIKLISIEGGAILSVPLTVSGEGGLDGKLFKRLGLHAKKFRAGFTASLRIRADVDAGWCITVAANPTISVASPAEVEIADGVWIDLTNKVMPFLRALWASRTAKLRRLIPCGELRDPAERAWRTIAAPINLPRAIAAAPLMAYFRPELAGFSGLHPAPTGISLSLRLTGQTSIGAALPAAGRLPWLQPVPDAPGRLNLTVPVKLDDDLLAASALRLLAGREFVAGPVRVRITSLRFYPAGRRLVAAAGVALHTPGHWFDSQGTVFIAGIPVADPDGTHWRVADLQFMPAIDRDSWNRLARLFHDQIASALGRSLVWDISAMNNRIADGVRQAIRDQHWPAGLRLILTEPRVTIESIYPAVNSVIIATRMTAGLQGELTVPDLHWHGSRQGGAAPSGHGK